MASKKHYTATEKKIFLEILKKYKDDIEDKNSDGTTLRRKAELWLKIEKEYNNSLSIDETRTVAQLKKLWANLKQQQRNALTKEKQTVMATGGGPHLPPVEIDPDIAMIAPHLMEEAPVQFSSNILPKNRTDPAIEMEEDISETAMIEYLDEDLLAEADRHASVSEDRTQISGSSGASMVALSNGCSEHVEPATLQQVRKKRRISEKRTRTESQSIEATSSENFLRDTTRG